jgi:hypothetical protein
MFTEEPAPDDPLSIGGQLYLRSQISALEGQKVKDYTVNLPSLLDLYFDARPNDRVRGFVKGRMSYDPLLPASSSTPSVGTIGANSGTSGSASLSSLFATQTSAPRVVLDQFWLRFDIAHTLFVTAGRQHVRWGTARVWAPTDFLHLRQRNPLDTFDARTGTTMIKVHLPVESNAWNFYAYGVTEGQNGTPSLATLAGAARAELVFGPSELGLGVFGRPDSRAKFAADFSAGIGDIDFYAEVAVLDQRESERVRYATNPTLPDLPMGGTGLTPQQVDQAQLEQVVEALYPSYRPRGYRPQGVVGLTYSVRYKDNDIFTIGGEYFFNALGYDDYRVYPGLVLPHPGVLDNPASLFYLGRHYAALVLAFPAPFKLDLHTFTLTSLGNLSDRSFITRFDYSYTLLTHLRFEAFVAAHYGRSEGNFRFGFRPPAPFDDFARPAALLDLGLALRLSI